MNERMNNQSRCGGRKESQLIIFGSLPQRRRPLGNVLGKEVLGK